MARTLFMRALLASTAAALTAMAFAAPVAAQTDEGSTPGNPPGNNGTIKVDDAPFDDHPDNEPHVDCVFEIDFYNYDEGDHWADVEFALQAPSGTSPLDVSPDSVFIGEDPAGGSDDGDDLDASQTYDLSEALADSGATPHPEQGFHVKLTIHADGSQGADVKHKVFWVEDCVGGAEVGGEETETGGPDTGGTDTGGGTEVAGVSVTRPEPGPTPAAAAGAAGPQVLGTQFERSAPALARTGLPLVGLLALGLTLALTGFGLVRRSRTTS